MSDGDSRRTRTRRECITYGGSIVGGTFLAGWTGGGGTETTPTDRSRGTVADPTATERETAANYVTDDGTDGSSSYTVSMSPMDEVAFDEWPRYHDGEPYPEIPQSEWLFDRTEVAAIANGEIEA